MTHHHHPLFQHALVVTKPWLSPHGYPSASLIPFAEAKSRLSLRDDHIAITSPLVMLYIRVGKALAEPSRRSSLSSSPYSRNVSVMRKALAEPSR